MLLAVGGSLVAAQPAHAAGTGTLTWTSGTAPTFTPLQATPQMDLTFAPSSTNAATAYRTIYLEIYKTSNNNDLNNNLNTQQSTLSNCFLNSLTGTGSPAATFSSCMPLHSMTNPTVIELTPGAKGGFDLSVKAGMFTNDTAGNYTISVTTLNGSAIDIATLTFTSAATGTPPSLTPGSPATSGLGDTSVTLNYFSDKVGNTAWSVRAAASVAPNAAYLSAANWSVLDLKHGQGAIMATGAQSQQVTGLTAGTAYIAYLAVAGQYGDSNVQTFTFTTTGGSGGGSGGGSSTPAPVAESAKPLPVWAAPILKQIPTLSKTLNTDGGKVSLTDGDFSSLKSVTVGGQAVTFSMDAKGDVNIPIPAGKAGTTADLVVTFTGGKMTIQDGIKYVAPVDLNTVPEAPVAGFKANSSKVSGALAASILYAAQIDHKANAIACSGFAASQAQVALATARAQAACDYATSAYANLTKATVTVVVNKAKAKSAAVGIKVYH